MKGQPVYVADASVVTALGSLPGELWGRLGRGETALAPLGRFATDALACHQAACLPDLTEAEEGNPTWTLLRRCLALLRPVAPDTFVIWAGVKGNAHTVEQTLEGRRATEIFLPRHYRRGVCELLGTRGEGLELNAACASSTAALALGAEMIRRGEARAVLVCAADVVSRFTFTGFSSLRALTPAICRPFDVRRDGLCLGDGAGALLLANEKTVEACGRRTRARLAGWAIGNDATHITAPARDAGGLTAVIRRALEGAELAPEEIQAFCAHGTGTVYNDAMELTALENVFGERRLPVFSIKGALGHTLGAAGVIEAALCVEALRTRTAPPTAGCAQPEARATGRVSEREQAFGGQNILTTNSGFGGVNAALILTER